MTDKKALIERLIQDKHISLDEGLLLLQTEKEYISAPYPMYPYYPQHQPGYWYYSTLTGKMEWMPYSNTISVGNGSISTGTTGTLTIGDGIPSYSVTSYPTGIVMSYTNN